MTLNKTLEKENPLNTSALRGFLVAGVVLFGLRPSECHLGVLYYQKPALTTARVGLFLTLGLHEQAPDARAIKKPGAL